MHCGARGDIGDSEVVNAPGFGSNRDVGRPVGFATSSPRRGGFPDRLHGNGDLNGVSDQQPASG